MDPQVDAMAGVERLKKQLRARNLSEWVATKPPIIP